MKNHELTLKAVVESAQKFNQLKSSVIPKSKLRSLKGGTYIIIEDTVDN